MLRRPTAIKILAAEVAGEETIARFEREVQLTARLTHPNTCPSTTTGGRRKASFYYAMEYLDGLDLERLVAESARSRRRASLTSRQVCGALAEAHAVGLVHRDIKPANI